MQTGWPLSNTVRRIIKTTSIKLMQLLLMQRHQEDIICFIMIDVVKYLVRDVACLQSGFPFRGAIEDRSTGSVKAVQMKDVDPDRGIDWGRVIRTELPGRKQPDWLQAADLLFVSRGSRFYAVCLDAPPGPAVCSPHFFHLRIRTGAHIIPAFVAWQINQPPFQRQLQQAAEGSSQLSIRRPVFEALSLDVPSMAQQQRIVALVDLARRERQVLLQLARNREKQLEALAETLDTATAPATRKQAQQATQK